MSGSSVKFELSDIYEIKEIKSLVNSVYCKFLPADVLFFKSSHLFILPSLAEGQPITLLEAWAAKLPVVASSVGSVPFFVNRRNGYLVKLANEKILAETILKAINNKKLPLLGENGFRLVRKNYTWDKAAQTYLKVYEKLAG